MKRQNSKSDVCLSPGWPVRAGLIMAALGLGLLLWAALRELAYAPRHAERQTPPPMVVVIGQPVEFVETTKGAK